MTLQDPGYRPRGRQRNDWQMITKVADDNPGQWVRADSPVNPSVAHQIRAGRYRVDPARYEVTVRQIDGSDPKRVFVFLRTREVSE